MLFCLNHFEPHPQSAQGRLCSSCLCLLTRCVIDFLCKHILYLTPDKSQDCDATLTHTPCTQQRNRAFTPQRVYLNSVMQSKPTRQTKKVNTSRYNQ